MNEKDDKAVIKFKKQSSAEFFPLSVLSLPSNNLKFSARAAATIAYLFPTPPPFLPLPIQLLPTKKERKKKERKKERRLPSLLATARHYYRPRSK